MNIEKYQNKMSYPEKPKKPHVPQKSNTQASNIVSPTPDKFRNYASLLEVYEEDMAIYKASIVDYREEDNKLYRSFKKDSLDEVGLTNHPKAEKIFNYAWQEGHSSGYREVFLVLKDLAELILED